jgi:conjugal transfer ATP-binding protein TraC
MPLALRKDEAPFAQILPYWEIRDGVVVLENGVMEVGLELNLPATLLAPEASLEALHAAVTGLLRDAVPQQERLRLSVEVAPLRAEVLANVYRVAESVHPAAAFLAGERARALQVACEQGRLVEHRAFLTCTYTPPGRRVALASLTPEEFERRRAAALGLRERLLAGLERAGMASAPLLDQGLFALIWRYFNPGVEPKRAPSYLRPDTHYPEHVLRRFPALAPPTLRSQLLGSDLARRWDHLWFSGRYARLLSLGRMPTGFTQGGMLGHLLNLPGCYWLTIDFVHEPYGPMLRALMAQARRLYAATGDTGGLTDYTDPSVRVGFREVDDALSHMSSSGARVYRVGLSLLLFEEDDETCRKSTREVHTAFGSLGGAQAILETAGLFTQFVTLAPGSGRANERTFLTLQENAADFFPLDGPWRGAGRPVSLLWNRWDGVSGLDPFDSSSPNWNGIVVGGSGTGKTFLMQTILSDLLREGAEAVIVDRGFGYEPLVRLFGGAVIPIEPDGAVAINPFDLPGESTEPDAHKKAFLLALLRAMLPSAGGVTESLENALLMSAVEQVYADAAPSLSRLAEALAHFKKVGKRAATAEERRLAQSLALRLEPWTGTSAFGALLDRPSTRLPDAPLIYFETSGLERHPELRAVGLLLVTDLIWRRVQQHPQRKKVVVLDEVWSLLKLPQAAVFVAELYRRFRRYGAAAYAVTQSLEDFQSEGARGILQNTTYHYLLRLPTEDDLIQRLLELNERAMAAYRTLASKKGVYSEALAWIRRESGLEGGVIVLRPSPAEYWAFTTSAQDIALRDEAVAKHGGDLRAAVQELARDHPAGVAGRSG